MEVSKLEVVLFRALFEYDELAFTAPSLPDNLFSSSVIVYLYIKFKKFIKEYQVRPTISEFQAWLEGQPDYERYATLATIALQNLQSMPAPARDWVISEFEGLVKQQLYSRLVADFHRFVKQKRLREFERELTRVAYMSLFSYNSFEHVFDSDEPDFLQDEETEYNFPTRIFALDADLRGFFRKELVVVMAALNVGKSWFCVHTAQSALLEQKRVLWLTLEMSRQRVLKRLFQSLTGLVDTTTDDEYEQVSFTDGDSNVLEFIPTLKHTDEVRRRYKLIKQLTRGSVLVVREFPSKSVRVENIRAELLRFQATHGAPPDVLIVDSISDMRTPIVSNRPDYGHVCRLLRAYAQDFSLSVIATHQANRAGLRTPLIGAEHTGEDIRVAQAADTGISLNQSREEYKRGVMRLFVFRARNARKNLLYRIKNDFRVGQFCLHSERLPDEPGEEIQEVEGG